jgi:hypothetical protein
MLQTLQVAAEFVRSGTVDNAMVRASLFHQLALGVLETFPLRRVRCDVPRTRRGGARAYRLATRFIDDCLSLPIDLGDVAAAAGTDIHALNAAFRRGRT